MTQRTPDDLWRDFPKTATEFEKRFATEGDCRTYWIEALCPASARSVRRPSPLWRAGRRPGLQAHRGSRGPTGNAQEGPRSGGMASGRSAWICYIRGTV
jgi:hypothetical protein